MRTSASGLATGPPDGKTYFAFARDHGSFAEATERCFGRGQCRQLDGSRCARVPDPATATSHLGAGELG
jgi:hypothetical protein